MSAIRSWIILRNTRKISKSSLIILFLLFSICSSCNHVEKQPLLNDLIAQYHDSIRHDGNKYYYNVAINLIDNDTVIMIEGGSFEHYWNYLTPPPPPGEEESVVHADRARDAYVIRYVGPLELNKDIVTLYVDSRISQDYLEAFVGKTEIVSDSAYIVNFRCEYNYEPRTLRFKIVDGSITKEE